MIGWRRPLLWAIARLRRRQSPAATMLHGLPADVAASIDRGIADHEAGRSVIYSETELREHLIEGRRVAH